MLQHFGLGTKMIGLKILTPSQNRQSPQWAVMAPAFKILEHFNALWLYCELSFMLSGAKFWALWRFFQLGREILDVLFIWNLNGLAGVNKRLLVKTSEPRGLFANVWLQWTVYWRTRIPPVLLKEQEHMYTHYTLKNSKFLAECFYGLNNNNL